MRIFREEARMNFENTTNDLHPSTLACLSKLTAFRTGKLLVNLDRRTVEVDGQSVRLTGKEYGIFELLSLRKGTTVTKEMFFNHLYGGVDEPELKIIDVFVCKLRKKLDQATGGENYIETVWGRGYVLRDPAGSDEHMPTTA
jgi:two-component system, cell cycle response regulator CtrA